MSAPVIDLDQCENNEMCLQVCPYNVFDKAGGTTIVARASACQECWLCVNNCPSGAIMVE